MSACVAPRHPKTMLVVLALSLLTLSAGARSPSATSVAEVWPQPVSFTQGTTQLTLTPGSFKIACGTSVCPAPLPAAFTRYLSLIFIGSASGKGLHANSTAGVNLPGVNVNVVADAPLALHVDESYTLTVRVRRGTAGCSMGVCACACVGGWRRARALWGRLNPRLAASQFALRPVPIPSLAGPVRRLLGCHHCSHAVGRHSRARILLPASAVVAPHRAHLRHQLRADRDH